MARNVTAASRPRSPVKTTLSGVVSAIGSHLELPFHVPPGVERIDVAMTRSTADAKVGIGLFDAHGAGYQSAGFRGVYGDERSSFFVSTAAASLSFLPGPMPPGTWTVIVPVFAVPTPTRVTVEVTMSFDAQGAPFQPGPLPGVVLDEPGWYRGDLHCHTTASSDAWSSHRAMNPAQWAQACRHVGLDFVAMTDHNVISQNYFLARDAGADVLLIAGEEMTNWSHGHATVSGIDVGQWLDWRQTPLGLPMPTGTDGARIRDFLRVAESMGAYVAAAHPSARALTWQFQVDARADPKSRTHGYEVWNGGKGGWGANDEASLRMWDSMLAQGWHTVANGGSDLHGVDDISTQVGAPTTVVYAQRLAQPAIIAALKAGRAFVTSGPDGVELYLTASRPGQRTSVGGTVFGAVGEVVSVYARVRGGGGMRVTFTSDGRPVSTRAVASDDETVAVDVPIGAGPGYVRAEVRGADGDMQAFTNPIWFRPGSVPSGYVAEVWPVPPHVGPRRTAQA